MLKVIELFSGVGAQKEALNKSGIEHEVVAISEIDKYSIKSYRTLHGWTLNLGDIKKIEGLPKVDLWTYSFPCTDISLSGQMKGFEKGSNTGSSLLWEVQRLLEVSKANNTLPRFLLMENVKNIVSKKFMPLFQVWIDYLSSLGYKSFYKVLNAKEYGVPQNRERCFMLSVLNYEGDFVFPEQQELKVVLGDLLEDNVSDKYFLSDRYIKYATDMENRNGFVRGVRFRPHDGKSKIAYTITTNPGGRATDNYIILPAVGAIRGRPNEEGKNIFLMSEAGLPCIADPGAKVTALAQRKGINIVPFVGPSSIFLSLMASGFNGQNFAFIGYLPVKDGEREKALRKLEERIYRENQTQIFIEAPYRNNKLISCLTKTLKDETLLCIASNITLENQSIRTKTIRQWRQEKDLDIKNNGYPVFWSLIKGTDTIKQNINYKLKCPMNYLSTVKIEKPRSNESTLPIKDFLNKDIKIEPNERRKSKKVEDLIRKYRINLYNSLNKNKEDYYEDRDFMSYEFDELIEDIKI